MVEKRMIPDPDQHHRLEDHAGGERREGDIRAHSCERDNQVADDQQGVVRGS